MNRKVLFTGLIVTLPLVLFLALGFRSDPTIIESPLIGRAAPRFALFDLEAERVSSKDFAGRPMLVNFWATWCGPCVAEHETLRSAAARYRDRVEFIGIVYQDEADPIREFLRQRGAWGRTLLDPTVAVAISYGVYGVPESFLIDKNGKIVRKFTGAMDPTELEVALREVV